MAEFFDTRRFVAVAGAAAVSFFVPAARGQATPEAPVSTPDTPSPSAAPEPTPAPDVSKLAAELEAQKKELAEQKKELAEQKKALEESQKTAADVAAKLDDASAANDNDWTNRFKIYGFTDVGVNRVWINERSQFANIVNSANATSFVVGNLNVYFDAQPVKNWRSLVEVRFTNAPHGEIASYGGLAGKFERTSTAQIDPHASSVAAQMWGGYTVIERAHIDWTEHQLLKVRVGNFFTPFGIWNVDHGSPTLIAVQLPGIIQLRQMPLRQTGIQVFGSTFAGDWELGYMATVSNGRQELSNFAFDDNRGFGGRVYASNEKGEVTMKFGASFYTGRVKDQQVNVVSAVPTVEFNRTSTFDYREIVGGLDASVDVGHLRLRAEAAMSSVRYDEGKHEPSLAISATPSFKPNAITTTGYLLAAYQLPFAPIEPFVAGDVIHSPGGLGKADVVAAVGGGFNVRFTKSVLWKNQFSRGMFFDTRYGGDAASDNSSYIFSRLVLVF